MGHKEGKKQRKFGRNKRKPGAARQELRTTRNKVARITRLCERFQRYGGCPGYTIHRTSKGVLVVANPKKEPVK